MTPATAAAFALALLLAALDVALPSGAAPRPLRRLVAAGPAAVLAIAARAQDAPALLALSLLAAAAAAALERGRGPEFAAGELVVGCVAALLLAALLFEMGSPRRVVAEPWRLLPGVAAAVAGAALLARRPGLRAGPVGSIAALTPSAAALGVLVAGALPARLWEAAAAAALCAARVGWGLLARGRPPSRGERALAAAAALVLAAAFLLPPPVSPS